MRVLAGIPTYNRKTAHIPIRSLTNMVDNIIVVAQGDSEVIENFKNVEVVREEPDLINARNIIFTRAIEEKYDYVIQVDDDLLFKEEVIENLKINMEKYHQIGAISSLPRIMHFWNSRSGFTCNWPIFINYGVSQLWIVRVNALKEIGLIRSKYPGLEDIEWGLHSWSFGWPCMRLMSDKTLCHNDIFSRKNKPEDSGGISPDMRRNNISNSIEELNFFYGPSGDNLIRSAKVIDESAGKYSIRVNWRNIIKRSTDRWGRLGYEDSSGKKL